MRLIVGIFVLGFSMIVVGGCSGSNSVAFSGARATPSNPLATPPDYVPGLSQSNGGFLMKSTQMGNQASVTLGVPVSSVKGQTTQGNTYELNLAGQISQ